MLIARFLSSILAAVSVVSAAESLGKYGADMVSTSGFASGARMAVQYHVTQSAIVMGVGAIAGGPFFCAENRLDIAEICMTKPDQIYEGWLFHLTSFFEDTTVIDATVNMQDDRVWLFSGTADTVVHPGVSAKTEAYYRKYVNDSNIKAVFDMTAGHTFPTENYGIACKLSVAPSIGSCGYYAAFELLNHIYGNLQRPNEDTELHGNFIEFNQSEYFRVSPPAAYAMDTTGYAYVPSACKNNKGCKLHVVFHGESQRREKIGDAFARNAGYNEVAELNNIIVVYPQTVATPLNPDGDWDWWGYNGKLSVTKLGMQIGAIRRMVKRALST
ncbi:PREDICTED: uncharacterized protein LOC106815555 [Priapulus caudatus]|uniref:Uncharacterized protein LOC106815555 n=1 Tax=Priapulus caudatus TaxID=37621 RepID=A0ABM1ETJ0_PRICU|nr:PREDICTED: uncharacterized protein LOC106815555 [Priapulus caudatus]